MEPARRGERGLRLAEAVGKQRDERRGNAERALDRRRLDGDRLERALAADTARGGRVEGTLQPAGVEPRRVELDRVRRKIVRQARGDRMQALGEREAERELLVVPGRTHRHRDRRAADPQLERLLDGEPVVDLRPAREPEHAARRRCCTAVARPARILAQL